VDQGDDVFEVTLGTTVLCTVYFELSKDEVSKLESDFGGEVERASGLSVATVVSRCSSGAVAARSRRTETGAVEFVVTYAAGTTLDEAVASVDAIGAAFDDDSFQVVAGGVTIDRSVFAAVSHEAHEYTLGTTAATAARDVLCGLGRLVPQDSGYCPSDTHIPLLSAAECGRAASLLTGGTNWSVYEPAARFAEHMPSGCFFFRLNKRFYFNSGGRAVASNHYNSLCCGPSPVPLLADAPECITSTPTTAPTIIVTADSPACPAGSELVEMPSGRCPVETHYELRSRSACDQAQHDLGFGESGGLLQPEEAFSHLLPSGCYKFQHRLYYNPHDGSDVSLEAYNSICCKIL
jgi:hypothetical protein